MVSFPTPTTTRACVSASAPHGCLELRRAQPPAATGLRPALSASIARISESAPPARHELLEDRLDAPATVDHVRMTRIELSPGQAAGRHRHPCPVFGYVLAGRIRFQLTGDSETILETGQAFHEPADVEVPHFDNASDDEAAVFVACYLLPPGEDRVIEMLDQ
jgi:quercetin dioxygenase-like cupin family protein